MGRTLLLLLLLLGFTACGDDKVAEGAATTDTATAEKTKSNVLIIDVRTKDEFEDDHIEGAVHIPYGDVFTEIKKYAKNKDHEIRLYCKSGGRAGSALKSLEALGYTNVKNLGGIADARKALDITK